MKQTFQTEKENQQGTFRTGGEKEKENLCLIRLILRFVNIYMIQNVLYCASLAESVPAVNHRRKVLIESTPRGQCMVRGALLYTSIFE